jgi:hypothetical protein
MIKLTENHRSNSEANLPVFDAKAWRIKAPRWSGKCR